MENVTEELSTSDFAHVSSDKLTIRTGRGSREGCAPATEKLLTFRAAAEALGVRYYKIQRAVRARLFPTYRIYNGRRLLKLSEITAIIDRSRDGGQP